MKKIIYSLFLFLFYSNVVQSQDATEIVRKADAKMRGKTLQAEMVIRTIRPTWTREMTVKSWAKGTQYSMILIKSPQKDEGIAFLKRKKEVWNWMPVLERTIKMPPSMMSQSWMGTDFNNDDLVRESSVLEDYTHSFLNDTTLGDRLCYRILMKPKPESAIVWDKVIVCIDKKDYLELNSMFYDEDGELVNIMNAYDIQMMDNRLIPTRMEMIPADKRNQKTELIYKQILYDRPIDDNFFAIENMKKLK
ncbi:MAG: outer membrane lipoprotein-sorting protein [Cyclobacteriaceae bacterium]|nr:outer membrane lipoprotein-sorting protein [Cyclobacteriaceae bacterium]